MKPARIASYLLAATLVTGCRSSVSTKVAPGGGSVKVADGTSVSIPAGAVAQPTVITIGNEPNAVSITDATLLGPVYRFEPEGTQFNVPVTVTIAYDPALLPAGAAPGDVEIMTAAVGSSDFVALPTSIVDGTHVSAGTMHFSDFVATVHKKPGGPSADMSSSVAADMSMTPPTDMTLLPAGDLSTPPDFASSCPHTWTASACTLSANATTCGGSFSLNCAQTICYCSGKNLGKTCPKPAPYTNTLTCPPQSDVEAIWTSCCMFP